jgi:hypothetical protein
MRSVAEAKLPIAIFVTLLAISVGLKAALPTQSHNPSRARPGLIDDQMVRNLESQGFSTRRQHSTWQGTTIFATRGDCRLSVRNASHSPGDRIVYERDAAHIGQLRYLIAGRSYQSPPTLAILIGKVETKFLVRLRIRGSVPVAVALATSPACVASDFGLSEVRVAV